MQMISLTKKKTLCLSSDFLSGFTNVKTNYKHSGELFLVSKVHEPGKYCKVLILRVLNFDLLLLQRV